MAVVKQTYTAAPTWTASGLANIYRSAFIDAGLMTDWHDSFLSGTIENRILRIQYDPAKTYGTTFYWFMFTTTGASLQVATGWNTTTDVPTGTQYLDFFATTTNATTNHWAFSGTLSSTTAADLIRYSSGNQHWFVSRQGTTRRCFTIQPANHVIQPWLNLNLGFYQGWSHVFGAVSGNGAGIKFMRGPCLRREITLGTSLIGSTTLSDYAGLFPEYIPLLNYGAPGNISNAWGNNGGSIFRSDKTVGGVLGGSIILPTGFTGTNPAYTSNSNPVFHSMPFTPYSTTTLNSDFGMTFHYATNVFGFQDKFVVTQGVEEWEVLEFTNASVGNGTTASSAFLARIL